MMSQALMLGSGEKVVHSWNGLLTHKVVEKRIKKGLLLNRVKTTRASEHEKGILVLTNQRLAWMQKRGRFSESFHLTHEIPLTMLSGISLGGTLFKYVTLSDGSNTYQFNLKHVGSKEFVFFRDMLMRQKEKAFASPTREVITREVVMISCPYCNGLMPQTSVFCPNCGASRKS